ncbi:MAG: hypothetical protein GY927_07915 [bacterium]|nr:hypothetical protein [bacterium]
MANERLPMRKNRDVLRLDFDGLSRRKIALSLQVERTTVREYLILAKLAGLCWPLPDGLSDKKLEKHLFPPLGDFEAQKQQLPDWKIIHKERAKPNVTLANVAIRTNRPIMRPLSGAKKPPAWPVKSALHMSS